MKEKKKITFKIRLQDAFDVIVPVDEVTVEMSVDQALNVMNNIREMIKQAEVDASWENFEPHVVKDGEFNPQV